MEVNKKVLLLTGALFGLGSAVAPVTTLAQMNRFRNAPAAPTSLTSPSRELQSLLNDAEKSIAAKEWSDATLALGRILGIEKSEEFSDEEFGVDRFYDVQSRDLGGDGKEIHGSLFQHIYQLLDNAPDEALQILEVRHGVEAKQALQAAIEANDWPAIERLSSQFGFLPVGQDARMLLADRALAQGETTAAASMFESLLQQKRASNRFGASLGLLAARSHWLLGNKTRAIEILKQTMQSFPSFRGTRDAFPDLEWTASSEPESTAIRLAEKLVSKSTHPFHPIVRLPLFQGGDIRRNADTAAGIPMPILRWHAELHESNQIKEKLANELKNKIQSSVDFPITSIPSRAAISNGRAVICSTYDQRIIAIDLQTGLLQWECVYTGLPLGFSLDYLPQLSTRRQVPSAETLPEHLLERVWGEASYGNISSDGERLFGVSDLSSLEVVSGTDQSNVARFGGIPPTRTHNVIQCWSIPQEGRLTWEVGGATSEQEPRLANAYFLGAPLPYRGELLVMAEVNGEVNLISLEPASGKLRWTQPLAQNAQLPVASNSLLRIVGASPTADGNLVLCPTLTGYLVAFDLHTRTLKWGLNYRQRTAPTASPTNIFGNNIQDGYNPFANRSVELSPTIGNGIAVYAPPDGFGVQAIDIATGERKWQKLEGEQDSVRYVGAITNDGVIVVTQNAVIGFNKDSGAPLWPVIPFGSGVQVTGRGVRQGNHYFVPLSNQTLLKIDTTTGRSERSTTLEHVPGNLVNVNDHLISVSPFQMECYAIADAFKLKMANLGATVPENASALIDQGELALLNGDIEGALTSLEQAYQLDPTNQDCWIRLRRTAVKALELDFNKYFSRIVKLEIDLDHEPAYTRCVIQAFLAQNKGLEAFEKLLVLSDRSLPNRNVGATEQKVIQLDDNTIVQEDRWIRVQISKAIQSIPDGASNSQLASLLEQQRKKITSLEPSSQRIKLNHLHALPVFDPERVQLANRLIQSRLFIDAEQLLMDVFNDLPIATWLEHNEPAAKSIATLYLALGRIDLVAKMANGDATLIQKLAAPIPSTSLSLFDPTSAVPSVPSLGTQATPSLNSIVGADSPMLEDLVANDETNVDSDWPSTKIEVTAVEKPNRRGRSADEDQLKSAQPIVTIGETLKDCTINYSQTLGALHFRTQNGRVAWNVRTTSNLFTANQNTVKAILIDGKAIFVGQGYLVGIDSLDPNNDFERDFLWTQSFTSSLGIPPQSLPNEGFSGRDSNDAMAGIKQYWGLPVPRTEYNVVHASRSEIILHVGDELIGLDPQNGSHLWKAVGFKNSQVAFDGARLYSLHPSGKITTLDRQTGQTLSKTDAPAKLRYAKITGKGDFFFADEQTRTIRLVRPSNNEVLLERTLSADFLLSFTEDANGFLALGNSGEYYYWNLETAKEFSHRIELRNKELTIKSPRSRQYRPQMTAISLATFANRILVLPYNSQFAYDNVEVTPGNFDGNYNLVSGSVFAVSPEDGAPLWKKTVPVMQYAFPIAQDRQKSPFAVMVRRFNLVRLVGTQNVQAVGVGVIDLRTGDVVYAKDDNQGIYTAHFSLDTNMVAKTIRCTYSGVEFNLSWTSHEADNLADQMGIFNFEEFRDEVRKNFEHRFQQPGNSNSSDDGSLDDPSLPE